MSRESVLYHSMDESAALQFPSKGRRPFKHCPHPCRQYTPQNTPHRNLKKRRHEEENRTVPPPKLPHHTVTSKSPKTDKNKQHFFFLFTNRKCTCSFIYFLGFFCKSNLHQKIAHLRNVLLCNLVECTLTLCLNVIILRHGQVHFRIK